MLQGGRSRVRFRMIPLDFSIDLNLPAHYGLEVDSDSKRNEYQEFHGCEGRPVRKVDSLTAICEPIVKKMWEPRRLTT
jgi:hypothetical protein